MVVTFPTTSSALIQLGLGDNDIVQLSKKVDELVKAREQDAPKDKRIGRSHFPMYRRTALLRQGLTICRTDGTSCSRATGGDGR
jgi:hypothetical protein